MISPRKRPHPRIGYGSNFGGLAPLLTMLNSCATGVAVVNIDNGYGAGHMAALINRVGERADNR
jgi:pyridinium-3,5-biscarboxylic acid mononucleotide synthase